MVNERAIKIMMTPLVRWQMAFAEEVAAFPEIFNRDVLEKLADRLRVAQQRSRTNIQGLLKLDLFLLVTLYAPRADRLTSLEGIGPYISAISFLAEGLLLASAFGLFNLIWNFITEQAYTAMLYCVSEKVTNSPEWNGRYLMAVYADQELALNVNAQRLNIKAGQEERWKAGSDMASLEKLPTRLLLFIVGPLALLHLGVLAWASYALIWHHAIGLFFDIAIVALALFINIGSGILAYRSLRKRFEFEKPFLAGNA